MSFVKEYDKLINNETGELMSLTSIVSSQINTSTCSGCFIEVERPKMREHIGRHIILGELKNTTNTCGQEHCNIELND